MSGGDDLESDDEYLNQNWHDNEEVEVELDVSTNNTSDDKKRSISDMENDPDSASTKNSNGEEIVTSKKKQKTKTPKGLLLEVGRGIADSGPEEQAFFLWTAFTHALKLKGEEIDVEKFTANQFVQPKTIDTNSKYQKSMAKYLKSGVLPSMKRLKKWKVEKSPMVIIVCVSALRAVEILKEISSLNLRVAKLFAKHMNIDDQVNMLSKNSYGIAVGTPNRLLKLLQLPSIEGDEGDGALSLDYTELIVIDNYEDKKKFTVCTMNDTAPDMMAFIKEGVVEQMKKRKSIKFGMF